MFLITSIYDNIFGKQFNSVACNLNKEIVSKGSYSTVSVGRYNFKDVSCVVYDTNDGVSEVYNMKTLMTMLSDDCENNDCFLLNQFLGIECFFDSKSVHGTLIRLLSEVDIITLDKDCIKSSVKKMLCNIKVSSDGTLEEITDELIHDNVLVIPDGIIRFSKGMRNELCEYRDKIKEIIFPDSFMRVDLHDFFSRNGLNATIFEVRNLNSIKLPLYSSEMGEPITIRCREDCQVPKTAVDVIPSYSRRLFLIETPSKVVIFDPFAKTVKRHKR